MKRQGENIQKQSAATKSSTDFDCKHIKDCPFHWYGCEDNLKDGNYNEQTGCTPYQQYMNEIYERAEKAIIMMQQGKGGIPQEEMRKRIQRKIQQLDMEEELERTVLLKQSTVF